MSEPISLSSPSGPGNPRDGDQYREYYIPIRSVEEEQELLEEYETDRFAHALREIYNEFYLMIELCGAMRKTITMKIILIFCLRKTSKNPWTG